jgi:L-xylulokinase
MRQYFLGLDNGGTVAKAAIFDGAGTEIGVASANVPFHTPQPGFAERDMLGMWKSNCDIIREVLRQTGTDPSSIAGVGCTGHGKGLYLWGKDHSPAYQGIVSTDTRAWEYPLRWQNDGTASRVFSKTFQKILACQPVSLLAWFRDHNPDVLKKVRWVFEAKDYIRFMLTGEAGAEITDYSGSGLMNIRDRCFDRELLNEYGLGDFFDALPPPLRSTDMAGKISAKAAETTGLIEGTPVAGGMFDIDACAIASGIVDPGNICVVAGTWSINEYVSPQPVIDGSVMMNSLFCLPEYYLIEESSPTSAGNYEWFLNCFLEKETFKAKADSASVYEEAEQMASAILPNQCDLVFLPFLFGSNYNPEARASFVGFSVTHTKAHMIRAVLEGIAFSHKTHLEKLLTQFRKNRTDDPVIRLSGGATKSKLWTQIMADIFGLPIETVTVSEPGALGAAMSAAVASGYYQDAREAVRHMVHLTDQLSPNLENVRIYERKYLLYQDIAASLDHVWSEFRY